MTQRYAQAGTVGKRQDVSKGMFRQGVAPKIARRTAAAGRGGRRIVTGTPGNDIIGKGLFVIPAAHVSPGGKAGVKKLKGAAQQAAQSQWQKQLVGKGVLSEVAGGLRAVKTNLGRGAAGAAKPKTPLGSSMGVQRAGGAGLKAGQFAAAKPMQFGAAAAGTGVLAGYGASRFGKRRFDPEDERRHRQGLQAGALGTGGALATGYGVRGVARDSKALRSVPTFPPPGREPELPKFQRLSGKQVAFEDLTPETQAALRAKHEKAKASHAQRGTLHEASTTLKSKRGLVLRGKPAALLVGGVGSMAGAAALHGQRRESRWD